MQVAAPPSSAVSGGHSPRRTAMDGGAFTTAAAAAATSAGLVLHPRAPAVAARPPGGIESIDLIALMTSRSATQLVIQMSTLPSVAISNNDLPSSLTIDNVLAGATRAFPTLTVATAGSVVLCVAVPPTGVPVSVWMEFGGQKVSRTPNQTFEATLINAWPRRRNSYRAGQRR